MIENSEIHYLQPFIQATISAAARFRRVLIIVIIASILAFGAFWNSLPSGWLNSRLEKARHAETYLISKETEEKLKSPSINEDERKKLNAQKANLDEAVKKINTADTIKWLEQRNIKDSEQLKPIITRLENARIENVLLIRIPFFGVAIDVNDLGIIGGFTFLVILMWFRFSLWREYYNLSLTFKETNEEHLEFCYKTLAMEQVLTVPPNLSDKLLTERPWGKVVRLLYFLPVLIQLIILINDIKSFETGSIISQFNSIFGMSVSLSFLLINAILTYWCLRLSSEIDREWGKSGKSYSKYTV